MELETHVAVGMAQGQVLGFQHHVVAERLLHRLAIILGLQAAAHHEVMQFRGVCIRRGKIGDDASVLHHIDAVGDFEHLVKTVRDEDEGGARFQ